MTLAQGAASGNVAKVFTDQLKGDDQTILRTRGYVIPSTNHAATDIQACLGMIVLPNRIATEASNSELPNPLVDSDTTDWFVWQPFLIPASLDQSSSDDEDPVILAASFPLEVDSKAKRLMEASESVVCVVGFNPFAAVSSQTITFNFNLRTLVGY